MTLLLYKHLTTVQQHDNPVNNQFATKWLEFPTENIF